MTRFLLALALALALLALAGCSSAEVRAVDGIAATNARFEETFNAGDAYHSTVRAQSEKS